MKLEMATFGGGCFWGVEARFRSVEGVVETAVGYEGGQVDEPTYEQVCTDRTGHAEVVQVEFDAEGVTYEQLLGVFFDIHDPTQADRQGPDVGRQYRSVVFTHTPEQAKKAGDFVAKLAASKRFNRPIATKVEPASAFWRAEEYHQRYLEKHGSDACSL